MPKDMLIKLMLTMKEEKDKEIDELKEKLELYESMITKRHCSEQDCEAVRITADNLSLHCCFISSCLHCQKDFCDNHAANYNGFSCICENCR